MYAVIETGGKQLVVKVGESIFVEKARRCRRRRNRF